MVEVLRNKNLATRFQILVAIANRGPNLKQQDIASELAVTPQAVSDYTRQLLAEGLLTSDGRSRYRVSIQGVNWIIGALRELRSYSALAEKAITDIAISAAVADSDLTKGQKVALIMKNGLLFAASPAGTADAQGITVDNARQGEDVGVTSIECLVRLTPGKVAILRVPNIQHGGSRKVDFKHLRKQLLGRGIVGAIGIEAIITLRRSGNIPFYHYGAKEAIIEAATSGLDPLVLCVEDEVSPLIRSLEAAEIGYELLDVSKT